MYTGPNTIRFSAFGVETHKITSQVYLICLDVFLTPYFARWLVRLTAKISHITTNGNVLVSIQICSWEIMHRSSSYVIDQSFQCSEPCGVADWQ